MSPKCVILGGGFAGVASARLLAERGISSVLIEAAPYLGAGVRTHWYGGHPYTFGPRHFITKEQSVFDYLNSIVPMRSCNEHVFLSYVESDSQFYNFPIHVDDIERMPDSKAIRKELSSRQDFKPDDKFEDYWIKSVGPTLYKKFIEGYTKKMWKLNHCNDFDTYNWSAKGVALKSGSKGVFDDRISAYPLALDGYNAFFDNLPSLCELYLNMPADFVDLSNSSVVCGKKQFSYDYLINTISPDLIMQERYGSLPYIGRTLHKIVLPIEEAFPKDVYFLYYTNDEQFTRIVEYKKFTRHKSEQTLLGLEVPDLNGRHYPMPIKAEMRRAERYFQDMPKNVFSIGRAGTYRYAVDIDDCIEQAMLVAEHIGSGSLPEHPVPHLKWRAEN
jgi:UDP-galactopyranose mutase